MNATKPESSEQPAIAAIAHIVHRNNLNGIYLNSKRNSRPPSLRARACLRKYIVSRYVYISMFSARREEENARYSRATNLPCLPSERAARSDREGCITGLNTHPRKSSRSRTRACPRRRAARVHTPRVLLSWLIVSFLRHLFSSSRSILCLLEEALIVSLASRGMHPPRSRAS